MRVEACASISLLCIVVGFIVLLNVAVDCMSGALPEEHTPRAVSPGRTSGDIALEALRRNLSAQRRSIMQQSSLPKPVGGADASGPVTASLVSNKAGATAWVQGTTDHGDQKDEAVEAPGSKLPIAVHPSDNVGHSQDAAVAAHEPSGALPSGWIAYSTEDGVPYYHNSTTDETSWTIPAAQ